MNSSLSPQTYRGSLELYCQEIFRTPLLTKPEERELALLHLGGDERAREQLIKANLRLVVSMAKKFCGMGLGIEDLIAEGNRGLMTAVERFNPHVGASLCTYASWWIRQSMFRAIEIHGRTIRLPGHVLTKVRKARAAAGELAQLLGREPDDFELAGHLGTTEARVAGMRAVFQPMHTLDEITADGKALHEKLAAESNPADDPFSAACHGCDSDRVQQILTKLPDRLRAIMEARFGIGGSDPLTLADIGKKLGVTRERVRQLESRALALLRQALYRMDPASHPDILSLSPAPRRRRVLNDETVFANPAPTPSPTGKAARGHESDQPCAHPSRSTKERVARQERRSFLLKRSPLQSVSGYEDSRVTLPG